MLSCQGGLLSWHGQNLGIALLAWACAHPSPRLRPPSLGESALREGQGVCCQGRRGHDRRRVQRPHPRRPQARRRAAALGPRRPKEPATLCTQPTTNPTCPRWGDGLHQAMEAKEKVPIQPETEVSHVSNWPVVSVRKVTSPSIQPEVEVPASTTATYHGSIL